MTLTPCADVSAADWLTGGDLPWDQLVAFGPAGFEAYTRLRFVPDPRYAGQSETDNERDDDAPSDHEQLRAALEVLGRHTRTPENCYFCLWDGWGLDLDGNGSGGDNEQELGSGEVPARPEPGLAPAPSGLVSTRPKVVLPHRAFFLFQGPLTAFGDWGATVRSRGWSPSQQPDPAFVWPADRAWCLANDVDPHYAGIGADVTAIDELLSQTGLDVVLADPRTVQPRYW